MTAALREFSLATAADVRCYHDDDEDGDGDGDCEYDCDCDGGNDDGDDDDDDGDDDGGDDDDGDNDNVMSMRLWARDGEQKMVTAIQMEN